MTWLVLALMLSAEGDVQVPCVVWSNPKGDTAGVIQVANVDGEAGKGVKLYDGRAIAVKLADNKARICRFGGMLRLADSMLGAYQISTEPAVKDCFLLVDLKAKKATLHDRKGVCAPALCPSGFVLNDLTFAFDPNTKVCTARRPDTQ